ncbi:MAG: Hsp20/alpha crystallin family protein [Candidatus Kapaibacterium sp.]
MSIHRNHLGNIYGIQRDLQKEVNRFIENFIPATRKGTEEGFESAVWRPVVDIHEDEIAYTIDAELPGMTKDDVRINFQEGTLSIAGERKYGYERGNQQEEGNGFAKDKSCHRMERFYGKFHRSFNFPSTVNADAINAKFDNGVLTVTVPKAEVIRPRQIEIV